MAGAVDDPEKWEPADKGVGKQVASVVFRFTRS